MSPHRKALLQIHFCVLLWGFTAIFGKLITLAALPLVWWRMLLVSLAIAAWPPAWRALRAAAPGTLLRFAGIGTVLALHWVSFYGAIKLANASVAATCMGFGPAFMAIIEPRIARRPFEPRELLIGILALPGVALVVGGTPAAMRPGIAVGVFSALLVAIVGSLNKRYVERANPLLVTWVELAAGAAFLTPVLAVAGMLGGAGFVTPDSRDLGLLLTLALACTLLPYALSLVALRHTSAFTTQLAVCLEPVYAVLLAILLLDEQRELAWPFYLGVAIIVGSVIAHSLRRPRSAPSTA